MDSRSHISLALQTPYPQGEAWLEEGHSGSPIKSQGRRGHLRHYHYIKSESGNSVLTQIAPTEYDFG